MGFVTAFRVPVEGLEQFQKAIDLISLIQEIVRNPNITDTVEELSKKLSDAQEMSDAKKKQLMDAEEKIAQARELIEDFEKEKLVQAKDDTAKQLEITIARKNLDNELEIFKKQKQELLDRMNSSEITNQATLLKVEQVTIQNNSTLSDISKREKELTIANEELQKSIDDFQSKKTAADNDLAVRKQQYLDAASKLEDDQKAFELRKAKFEAAIRGT